MVCAIVAESSSILRFSPVIVSRSVPVAAVSVPSVTDDGPVSVGPDEGPANISGVIAPLSPDTSVLYTPGNSITSLDRFTVLGGIDINVTPAIDDIDFTTSTIIASSVTAVVDVTEAGTITDYAWVVEELVGGVPQTPTICENSGSTLATLTVILDEGTYRFTVTVTDDNDGIDTFVEDITLTEVATFPSNVLGGDAEVGKKPNRPMIQ